MARIQRIAQKIRMGWHVIPSGDGKWTVKNAESLRSAAMYFKKADAIRSARSYAKNNETEIYIHGRDGRIQDRSSYAKDPLPAVKR